MAWTRTKIVKSTDNSNIVTAMAEYVHTDNTTFQFKRERIDISSSSEKSQFVTDANNARDAWISAKSPSSAETALLNALNA